MGGVLNAVRTAGDLDESIRKNKPLWSSMLGRLDAMFQRWNIPAFFAANMRRCDGAGALRPTSDAERLTLLPPEVQAYIRHHRL